MKTKLHLLYPFYLAIALMMTATSCSESHKDGKLPQGYSWAYGVWQIRESFGEDEQTYRLLIGDSYLQSEEGYQRVFRVKGNLDPEELYPIYTLTRQEYNPYPEGASNPDEICLSFEGAGGYEEFLYLDKHSRTVSSRSAADRESLDIKCSSKRLRIKENPDLIRQYDALLQDSPANGTWKNVRNRRDKLTITTTDGNHVLTRSGLLINLEDWSVTEYLPDSDRIKVYYSNTEDYVSDIYARFDPEKEREEELASRIAGKTFSLMRDAIPGISNSLGSKFVLYFAANNTGTSIFYNINLILEYQELFRHAFTWKIEGENLVTKNLGGDNSIDYFLIETGPFGTSLVGGNGDRYTRD